LVGVERYVTRYSEPGETDFIARHMNNAYAGLAVRIDGFGDSTYWGADTANRVITIDSHGTRPGIVRVRP